MLRILLLDQDREFMDRFIKYSLSTGNFMVIGAASDGETALKIMETDQVDIALVDLEMPSHDGQYVLDKKAFAPKHRPVFIIGSELKLKKPDIFQLGDEILKIWEEKQPFRKISKLQEGSEELTPLPRRSMKRNPKLFIKEVLHKIGAPFHLKGNEYLQTAFLMIVEEGSFRSGDLMNRIYPDVAKLHKTTSVQVERGIRYMTTRTMTKGRDLIITNYLGIPMIPPGKRLTNGELLTALTYCYFRDNEEE